MRMPIDRIFRLEAQTDFIDKCPASAFLNSSLTRHTEPPTRGGSVYNLQPRNVRSGALITVF